MKASEPTTEQIHARLLALLLSASHASRTQKKKSTVEQNVQQSSKMNEKIIFHNKASTPVSRNIKTTAKWYQ